MKFALGFTRNLHGARIAHAIHPDDERDTLCDAVAETLDPRPFFAGRRSTIIDSTSSYTCPECSFKVRLVDAVLAG